MEGAMKSLQGKVVLVTGAGKGAGRRATELLAARGAVIAAVDLTPINLDETISIITSSGGVGKPYLVDIAKKLPIQGLLNQVLDDLGSIDILINCAEVDPQRPILEMDEWDWVRSLDVNLTGAFLLTQSASRIMKEKGGGIIIHVSESAAKPEGHAAYLASKAGLEKMVESAAAELVRWNIHVHLAPTAEEAVELCCR